MSALAGLESPALSRNLNPLPGRRTAEALLESVSKNSYPVIVDLARAELHTKPVSAVSTRSHPCCLGVVIVDLLPAERGSVLCGAVVGGARYGQAGVVHYRLRPPGPPYIDRASLHLVRPAQASWSQNHDFDYGAHLLYWAVRSDRAGIWLAGGRYRTVPVVSSTGPGCRPASTNPTAWRNTCLSLEARRVFFFIPFPGEAGIVGFKKPRARIGGIRDRHAARLARNPWRGGLTYQVICSACVGRQIILGKDYAVGWLFDFAWLAGLISSTRLTRGI